ncbi:hypothetical protein [Chthoniobacter flavus]|uniref:hypothetical protein n=1 Tax=Chthoniobacter flavus TaxID=191863 RepID=UPI001052B4C5|nr:hypothetical protein [Chthoniobacter flavus]
MESSPPNPTADQNAANAGPPTPSSSTPPPLPQQIQRFRAACWIGLVSGGLWALVGGAALLAALLKPMVCVLTGLPVFLLPPVALTQSLTAYLLLKGRPRVLQIFCASSILAGLVIFLFGASIFGALNLVPIILLMLSAGPDLTRTEARENQETNSATLDLSASPSTPAESREDIY